MPLSTREVNEIIVYGSFSILMGVGLVGLIIFFVRMKPRRPSDYSSESSSDKSLQLNKDKKKSKSKKKMYGTTDDTTLASEHEDSTETSSLLADRNDSTGQSSSGAATDAIRATFQNVMSEGLSIVLHSGDSYMQVKMTLSGSELKWRSRKVMSTKSYKMSLREVQFIEWGKQTQNFKKPELSEVKDENCFSLVTEDTTFDFETSSKAERDALVQGFMLAIKDLREKDKRTVDL